MVAAFLGHHGVVFSLQAPFLDSPSSLTSIPRLACSLRSRHTSTRGSPLVIQHPSLPSGLDVIHLHPDIPTLHHTVDETYDEADDKHGGLLQTLLLEEEEQGGTSSCQEGKASLRPCRDRHPQPTLGAAQPCRTSIQGCSNPPQCRSGIFSLFHPGRHQMG
jgi:hypothetical protein